MFLLTNEYVEDGEQRAQVVLVAHSRAVDLPGVACQAWALSEPPTELRIEPAYLSELIGRIYIPNLSENVLAAAQNRLALVIRRGALPPKLPVFLTTTPEHHPYKQDIIVKLNVPDLSSLPDVQAHLAFARSFEEASALELPLPMKYQHSTELAQMASRMSITTGLYLPVHVENVDSVTIGCIYLRDSKEHSVFGASLFLVDPVRTDADIVLRRRVEWLEHRGNQKRSFEAVIATVLRARG